MKMSTDHKALRYVAFSTPVLHLEIRIQCVKIIFGSQYARLDLKKDADTQDHSHRPNAVLQTENTYRKCVQTFGRNVTKCEISGFGRGVAKAFAVL
jgi:hypothetical protein